MKYNEILQVFEANLISEIDADIVSCVSASLSEEVSDEEFNLLCSFVKHVWDDMEKGYTQLIADIVVDLYQDCGYGYRNEEKNSLIHDFYGSEPKEYAVLHCLTLEDLKEDNYLKREMVAEIFSMYY